MYLKWHEDNVFLETSGHCFGLSEVTVLITGFT